MIRELDLEAAIVDETRMMRAVVAEFGALDTLRRADPDLLLDPFATLVAASQYRYLYALADAALPAASRVLDWGCGEGHFTHFLLSRGHRVTAHTLQHEPPLFRSLDVERKARLRSVHGPGNGPEKLPFEESFDAVFSVGVLEHVRETGGSEEASLRELYRVLRPGGTLLCFHLPNRFSYIECASRATHLPNARVEACAGDKYHLYRYRPEDVRKLFTEAGFEILLARRYGILPRNTAGRILGGRADSPRMAKRFNRLDAALERIFSVIAQNHMVIARRPLTR